MQLSLPTVTSNLDYLKKQGLIDTSGKIRNTGGRSATAFSYIKDARMAIGVDITANHITAGAVNLSGGGFRSIWKTTHTSGKSAKW